MGVVLDFVFVHHTLEYNFHTQKTNTRGFLFEQNKENHNTMDDISLGIKVFCLFFNFFNFFTRGVNVGGGGGG